MQQGHQDVFWHGKELLISSSSLCWVQPWVTPQWPLYGDDSLPTLELVRAGTRLLDDAHACGCLMIYLVRLQALDSSRNNPGAETMPAVQQAGTCCKM